MATAPTTAKRAPAELDIYEDSDGNNYVLLKPLACATTWKALVLQPTIHVAFLSQSNLERLHLIGRAHLHA